MSMDERAILHRWLSMKLKWGCCIVGIAPFGRLVAYLYVNVYALKHRRYCSIYFNFSVWIVLILERMAAGGGGRLSPGSSSSNQIFHWGKSAPFSYMKRVLKRKGRLGYGQHGKPTKHLARRFMGVLPSKTWLRNGQVSTRPLEIGKETP